MSSGLALLSMTRPLAPKVTVPCPDPVPGGDTELRTPQGGEALCGATPDAASHTVLCTAEAVEARVKAARPIAMVNGRFIMRGLVNRWRWVTGGC